MEWAPLVTILVMTCCAIASLKRVRGRVGRNLAQIAGTAAVWAAFLFLEYRFQAVAESAISHIAMFAVRTCSALAGISVFAMAGSILHFAVQFPPRTELRSTSASALWGLGFLVALTAPLGLKIQLGPAGVTRDPTIAMYLHAATWFAYTLGGVTLLFRKTYALSSPMRRTQVAFFPIALLQAVVLGGVTGYALPHLPSALIVTVLAPSSFAVTMILGTIVARGAHRRERDKQRDQRNTGRPLFVILQRDFDLTYREATICELVHRGHSRQEIIERLGIEGGTLKVQLNAIFRKTLAGTVPLTSRDKLQRLTVFLSGLAGDQ